ncbi:MAG TPA: TolC family protein [Sulfuricaulis sp.]
MWRHFFGIIIYCWLSGIGTVLAVETFDLDRAVKYALEHNPDLLILRARSEATTARAQTAAGERLPSLGLSYMARASNNPLDAFADKLNTRRVTTPDFDPARLNHPGTSDLHATQLTLRMPVYSGGRLTASVTGAEEMEKHARLEYERAREVTAFQTLRAYLGVQSAQDEHDIADDAVKAAEEHARTTAQLARAGRIVVSDQLTAEVNLSALHSRREQAVTRLTSARNQLKLIMGLPHNIEIELAPARIDIEPFPDSGLTESEARALAGRKDLAAARALSQATRSQVRAARAVQKPRVDFIATTNWYDDNPGFDAHSSSVMGVVSLDLYAGGRHQGEIGAALAEDLAAHWRVQSQEHAVRHEVRETYEHLRELHARHTRATENVERARENVRLIKQRYGQGRTILIDLLQAERSYTETRHEELISRQGLLLGQAARRLAEGTLALPPGAAP